MMRTPDNKMRRQEQQNELMEQHRKVLEEEELERCRKQDEVRTCAT